MAKGRSNARTRTPSGRRERLTVVIATEGERTEPDYFTYLQRKKRSINVEHVPRNHSHTEPMQVLCDLIKHKKKLKHLGNRVKGFWIVIDNDKRPSEKFHQVAATANQHGVNIADSNPSFELWLLLHHRSLDSYSEVKLEELKANEKGPSRSGKRRLERELAEVLGSYNKRKLKESDFMPYVKIAIENAAKTDTRPNDRWLNKIGSRVYKLVQSIIDSLPHNPFD